MGRLRRTYTILLFITLFVFTPTHLLFSAGRSEDSRKNERINSESSSSGIIYSVDYTPPRNIDIKTVHYIQVKIYDSLGNEVNNIYYLKSSDINSKKYIFNILLPDNRFKDNSDLILSIDYYDVDNGTLDSINEKFKYTFHLTFETIKKDENGLGPYRKSNKLFSEVVDKIGKITTASGGNTATPPQGDYLTEEYLGNISEEIQELLFDNESVQILLETVICHDEDYDINKIKEDNGQYTGQLKALTKILEEYLADNFHLKINSSHSDGKSDIENIISYKDRLESPEEDILLPYVRIYLITSKDDLTALKKNSLETSIKTINSLEDAYIAAERENIDSDVSSLKKELLSLFEKNEQSGKEYLDKNGEYTRTLSKFHTSFEEEKKRLEVWLNEKRSIIVKATENREDSQARIGTIQRRAKEIREGIAIKTTREMVVHSMQKELEFLQEEEVRLGIRIDEFDVKIDSVVEEVNGKIGKFNRTNNRYAIVSEEVVNEETDKIGGAIGSYSLLYKDEDEINPDRMADIAKLDAALKAIIDITEKEREDIGPHLRYLPDPDELEQGDKYIFTLTKIVDRLKETLNTLKENKENFNAIVVKQIKDVTASDEFDNIFKNIQQINNTLGVNNKLKEQPSSTSLVDGLKKIVEINQYFNDAMYRQNSSEPKGKTESASNVPVLKAVYDAIDALPVDGELAGGIDKIVNGSGSSQGSRNPLDETERQNPGNPYPTKKTYPLFLNDQLTPDMDSITSYIFQKNPKASKDKISNIVHIYFSVALMENVDPLVAIAQMLHHTKYLSKKEITDERYNFGLLGSNDENLDWTPAKFSSPSEGISAHIQHIKAYSTKDPIKSDIVDPRYEILERKGLIGTKTTLREMVNSWYAVKDPDRVYYGIVTILEQLEGK